MIVPFSDTASFSQQIVLDDEIFNMTINYNSSKEYWTMDLLDANNNEIFTNAKSKFKCSANFRKPAYWQCHVACCLIGGRKKVVRNFRRLLQANRNAVCHYMAHEA